MVDTMPDDPKSQQLTTLVAALPLWQLRVLAHIQLGKTREQTVHLTAVSLNIVKDHARPGTPFGQLLAEAEAGVPVLGRAQAQHLARARSPAVVEAWGAIMEDPTVAPRDRIQAGRQIAEAAGLVGQPGTINVVQVNNQQAERQRLNEARHKPDIVEGVASTDDTAPLEPDSG